MIYFSKRLCAALGLSLLAASVSNATPIKLNFDFTDGFTEPGLSTGRIIFDVFVDSTTPDLDGDADAGLFSIDEIRVTGSGLSNEKVIAPDPLFLATFGDNTVGGLSITDGFPDFLLEIGWNGGPGPSSFMTDVNSLLTLSTPSSFAFQDSFFVSELELEFENGDFLILEEGEGSGGILTISAASAVPDVGFTALSLGLSLLGLLSLARIKLRR